MSKQYHFYVLKKASLNKAAKLSRLSVVQAEIDKWASRIILAQERCRPDLEAGALERYQQFKIEANQLKSEIDQLNHQIVTAEAATNAPPPQQKQVKAEFEDVLPSQPSSYQQLNKLKSQHSELLQQQLAISQLLYENQQQMDAIQLLCLGST
jgi:chromosome segregation ATPase